MKKQMKSNFVAMLIFAIILTSLPVNLLTVQASQKEAVTEIAMSVSDSDGVAFGDNGGFRWVYENSTATLTVTGEDSGLNNLRDSLSDTIRENVKNIVFQDCVVSGDMSNLLYCLFELKNVEFHNFDSRNVTDMTKMFMGCFKLESVNLSDVDTENVTSMDMMFYTCTSLETLDVSSFDTGNVITMDSMFGGCSSLTGVDVSGFDTSKVTDMGYMFGRCSSLETLDVSNFDTANVTTMNGMFCVCTSLKALDLSGFDTNNVTDMASMFADSTSLEALDLSGFNTGRVKFMNAMFDGCSSLETLNISSFDTGNVKEMMSVLKECSSLSTIHTPKRMQSGQSIELPDVFFDSEINKVTELTSATCNKILSKGGKSYNITYFLNGGKNNADNPLTYMEGLGTKALKKPVRTGYTFGGWYSDSSYKTKVTKISKTSTGNKTLYAKWTLNKYTIKFDKNGATSGTMKALKDCKYGSSYTLSANKFKRKGYTFKGWNTKKNGKGKNYEDRAKVKNLTAVNGKTVTLYARWKKESYKITYKLYGGTNKSSNPKKYDITTKTIILKAPTRKGYTFEGWYKDSKFKKPIKKITKGSTGNITLYAKWVKNKTKK